MTQPNTKNERPTMPRRRKVVSALAVIAIAASTALLPATPAAAETYEVDCYGNPEGTGPVLFQDATIEITADGPANPVAPGETFSLTNLTVLMIPGGTSGASGFVTVLGQEIDLGSSFNNDDGNMQWGPMTRTLTAPTEFGEHDIEPEGNFHRIAPNGFNFYCPFGEDPNPFASVEVADVDPTPTTTTTVPANGNGGNGDNGDDNGNGNGDGNGETEAEREARTQAELETELQAEAEALEAELATTAAEAAQLVGATPRFTG